ncbi:MAG: ion transporter [Gammaproteobacteria bacterium]|nr:ion transporter [Gammaproteobacteria bacterium]
MAEENGNSALLRLRKRTAEVLFSADQADPLTHIVDVGLITLISLNVIAVILESVHMLRVAWLPYFFAFEVFSVAVFSVEYALRVWTAVDNPWRKDYRHPVFGRLRYARTVMAIIDLLAIAPFYLAFVMTLDLRFLRVLRLLRIFKLTRYSPAMTMLFQVVREEMRTMTAALFVLALLLVVASSLAFIVEHGANPANPDAFASIPAAMYWAIITMTTVGYGDVVPVTPMGKMLGALIGVIGLGMVALPAGILASGFNNALHRRREVLRERITDALADGVITEREEGELEGLLAQLNLNAADAKAMTAAIRHARKQAQTTCPHCGKPLDEDPEEEA